MKKIIIIVGLIVVVIVPATLYLMGYLTPQDGAEGSTGDIVATDIQPLYLPLDPPFIVNFSHLGTLRYLQVSLEVMYHQQELLDRVTTLMPAIRNSLILLMSNKEFDSLSTLEGKEGLRDEMIGAINELIKNEESANNESYEAGEIYITNFVMQ